MSFKTLTTIKQVDEWLDSSKNQPVLFFKHSTRCPISQEAYEQFEQFQFTDEATRLKMGLIFVIEHRDVSNYLEEKIGVRHESPQAILVENQQVLWHDSHRALTISAFQQAVKLANKEK